MAAAQLPQPGTEYGPCALGANGEYLCDHTDCATTYGMANVRCPHCGKRIGFQEMFYQVGDSWTELAHQICHLESLEAAR